MGSKTLRNFCRAAAFLALSTVVLAKPAAAAPLSFVYKGAGCTGKAAVAQYETVLGHKVDGVSDFLDWTSSWSNMVAAANWSAGCWQGSGYKLNLSVPLMVKQNDGSPLHELATGQFNTYFTQIAKTLVAHGYGNAYIRLGEEFNYQYYPWAAANSPALWIQGYRQAQAAMKAVPGANFRFVWNPALWYGQFSPDQAYPGDDVVDVMGVDVYNQSWNVNYTNPASRWNDVTNLSWGLTQFIAFAKKHNKPYAFPEWGTGQRSDGHGGPDDPLFVANMAPLVKGSEYAGYWDFNAGDYNGTLSGAPQPSALAAFDAAFGSSTAGAASSIPLERNIGAIMTGHASTFTPEAAPVVTCTNCYAATIQNAPGHWMVIVHSLTASPHAIVSWNLKPSIANVYNPSTGNSIVQGLGQATTATFALAANAPMIVALQR